MNEHDTADRLDALERRLDGVRVSRDSWTVIVYAIAAVALIASFVAIGVGMRAPEEGGDRASAAAVHRVEIELGDMYVEPSSITAPAGAELVATITNAGVIAHDLQLASGVGSPMLQPGESAEVSFGVITEEQTAFCTVPGHREAGMELRIEVAGVSPAEPETADQPADAPPPDEAAAAAIDFNAEPAPDFRPYDPALEPAPGATEHEITIRATEELVEVAPGVTQELWLFNGQYPGPVLRGKVGDLFTITLVNEGRIGHSIDFHASKVAWNDEMRTIQPGESLIYQFEAKHAGIFMYHCGTPPALHHIGNGMFGAIIIDPPDLAPVDHEYTLVQSELYLGPPDAPGDLGKMQSQQSDAVVFNGYVNQYLHHPIQVEPGERVRLWVLDAGPNESSAFHLVGTVFDTVYAEGAYQLRPDDSSGGSQALALQPSQGGFVEFTFDEPGLYPIVTHQFAFVGQGALGLFQAGEAEPASAGH